MTKGAVKIALIFSRKLTQESSIPPFGIMYLAAMLRKQGYHAIKLFDMAFDTEAMILSDCKAFKPDVIGLSSDSIAFERGAALLHELKVQVPAFFLVGGIHATIDPLGVLLQTRADVAVLGEGEATFVELVEARARGLGFKNIPGLAYLDHDTLRFTEPRAFITDLDQIPFPARDLLPMSRYLNVCPDIPMHYPTMPIMASRGCKANCLYCQPVARKLFGNKMRCRSVQNIIDEIIFLQANYKFKGLYFIDDELLFNGPEWVKELCEAFIRNNLKLQWSCQARVDQIDEELLSLMKQSGCYAIGFGVESGSQKILNYMRKGYRIDQIETAFALCRKYKIVTTSNFMVGTPGESKETIHESISLIRRIRPNLIRCSITTPTPGSDLYDCMEKEGRINIKKLADFDRWAASPIRLDGFSQADIEAAVKQIVGVFYSQFWALFYNPVNFFREFYFIRNLAVRYLQLLWNPRRMWKDITFYLRYSSHRKGK